MSLIELRQSRVKELGDDLQVVVIDSFYDMAVQNDECAWLNKLFRFKVNSFLGSYPYGMLPFGAADLVGTHWILCRKDQDGLHPLMGIKTIDSDRTDIFRMNFPAFEYVSDSGLEAHRNAIQHEYNEVKKMGRPLGYVGSWVVAPEVRNDPALGKLCKKMSSALISRWIDEFDIRTAISFASLRFHVEKFHAYLGVTRLTGPNNEHLPDFKARPSFDEPACVSVFYRKNHSEAAKQDMADSQPLWEKRIVIASDRSPLFQQKPAARVA